MSRARISVYLFFYRAFFPILFGMVNELIRMGEQIEKKNLHNNS